MLARSYATQLLNMIYEMKEIDMEDVANVVATRRIGDLLRAEGFSPETVAVVIARASVEFPRLFHADEPELFTDLIDNSVEVYLRGIRAIAGEHLPVEIVLMESAHNFTITLEVS